MGGPQGGAVGLLKLGLGLMYGRFRVDPDKNLMAVSINWRPCLGCFYDMGPTLLASNSGP